MNAQMLRAPSFNSLSGTPSRPDALDALKELFCVIPVLKVIIENKKITINKDQYLVHASMSFSNLVWSVNPIFYLRS
jgi:hypothetical protein